MAGIFHLGVAQTIDAERRAIRERDGFEEERLSSGAFQNWIPATRNVGSLRGGEPGFARSRRLPCFGNLIGHSRKISGHRRRAEVRRAGPRPTKGFRSILEKWLEERE